MVRKRYSEEAALDVLRQVDPGSVRAPLTPTPKPATPQLKLQTQDNEPPTTPTLQIKRATTTPTRAVQ